MHVYIEVIYQCSALQCFYLFFYLVTMLCRLYLYILTNHSYYVIKISYTSISEKKTNSLSSAYHFCYSACLAPYHDAQQHRTRTSAAKRAIYLVIWIQNGLVSSLPLCFLRSINGLHDDRYTWRCGRSGQPTVHVYLSLGLPCIFYRAVRPI